MASSRMMTNDVADGSRIAAIADGHPNLHVIIDGLGGAVGRVAPDATAFPHRSAAASVQIYLKTTSQAAAAGVRWRRPRPSGARWSARAPTSTTSTPPCRTGRTPTTAPIWAGCAMIAQDYDPNRVFTFPQAVNRS